MLSFEKNILLIKSWIVVRASALSRGGKNTSTQNQNTCAGQKARKVISGTQWLRDSLTFVADNYTCK